MRIKSRAKQRAEWSAEQNVSASFGVGGAEGNRPRQLVDLMKLESRRPFFFKFTRLKM